MNVSLILCAVGQIFVYDPLCPPPPICQPQSVYIEPQIYVRYIMIPGEIVESKYQEWIEYQKGYEKVTVINGMAPSIKIRHDSYGNKWVTYDYRDQIDVRDCRILNKPKKVLSKVKYEEDVDKPSIPTNNDGTFGSTNHQPKRSQETENLRRPSEILKGPK